jgi:hypothetical protein
VPCARTYDTLNATQAHDVGFGWRLEFRHVDLRVSVPRTTLFEQELGIFNPLKDGSRVYVTLPGGKREAFTFHPRSRSGFERIFGFWHPGFDPDPGVTSRLSAQDETLIQTADGAFFALFNGGTLAYNPEDELNLGGSYSLSTKEGLGYQINARTGDVRLISDPNGNSLTFTNNSTAAGTTLLIGQNTVIGTPGSGGVVINGSGTTEIAGTFASVASGNHKVTAGLMAPRPRSSSRSRMDRKSKAGSMRALPPSTTRVRILRW